MNLLKKSERISWILVRLARFSLSDIQRFAFPKVFPQWNKCVRRLHEAERMNLQSSWKEVIFRNGNRKVLAYGEAVVFCHPHPLLGSFNGEKASELPKDHIYASQNRVSKNLRYSRWQRNDVLGSELIYSWAFAGFRISQMYLENFHKSLWCFCNKLCKNLICITLRVFKKTHHISF